MKNEILKKETNLLCRVLQDIRLLVGMIVNNINESNCTKNKHLTTATKLVIVGTWDNVSNTFAEFEISLNIQFTLKKEPSTHTE